MLTQKLPSSFQVFQFIAKDLMKDLCEKKKSDLNFDKILRKLKALFWSRLPDILASRIVADQIIEDEIMSKLTHRRFYQLWPVEQNGTRKWFENLSERKQQKK